jgi:hypothetical protein
MPDDRSYLIPHRTSPKVFRSMSGYLQSIAHNGPPLTKTALPAKAAPAPAKAAVAEEKKEQKKTEEEKKKETTFIEVVLVGQDGKTPVYGEPYVLTLPDGTKKEGRLDGSGKIRVAGLEKGKKCKISFPELDGEAWEPEPAEGPAELPAPAVRPEPAKSAAAAAAPAAEQAEPEEEQLESLQIELLDEAGKPAAGLRFVVQMPDGAMLRGKLDASGQARIDGFQPGEYQVGFPDLDQSEWEARR